MTAKSINIHSDTISATITSLQRAGHKTTEGVILWLGRRNIDSLDVVEAYEPEYKSEKDFFRIPSDGMSTLLEYLGDTGMHIIAQVHSHPRDAFHSRADDTWAIVRHVGALSLVLPYFARRTTVENFLTEAAAFSLTADDRWLLIEGAAITEVIRIV